MQKFEGIHFYVNVANFNEVVIDEESKNGIVNHSIHKSAKWCCQICSLSGMATQHKMEREGLHLRHERANR